MTTFARPSFRLFIQVVFWMLLLGTVSSIFLWVGLPSQLLWRNVVILLGVVTLLTLNIYVLFPRYLIVGRYGRYLLLAISSCLFMVINSILLDLYLWEYTPAFKQFGPLPFPERMRKFFIVPPLFLKGFFFFFSMTSSSLIEHIYLQQKSERLAEKVKAESAATELAFLKSQINPHFLLNALNNIYGLSIRPGGNNSEAVLQLSEMLRYVLYECNKPLVPLAAEIDYIQHYIGLQQLKDAGRFNVKCRYPSSTQGYHIAPMLLIPLVENAFKHSVIENLKEGWIRIELAIQDDHLLHLRIQNSVLPQKGSSEAPGGIGLKNVLRRLELLYPQRHTLQIREEQHCFTIDLSLHLQTRSEPLLQPN
ncbi:MAG: histidine kinase [Bacteroidota bacterium]